MSRRKLSPEAARLEDRMAALSASDEEVAALIGVEPGEVRDWRQGKAEIHPEARVKLRPFLADDPHAAAVALERERTKVTRSMVGEGVEHSGVTPPPYGGGYQGRDGEPVPTIPPLPATTSPAPQTVRDGERYGRQEA